MVGISSVGGAFWLPFDLIPSGADDGFGVTLVPGGIVVVGRAVTALTGTADMAVARLLDGVIFDDGFESHDLTAWSLAVGSGG